jgi:conserved oligomeric Golgi complex subunit 6
MHTSELLVETTALQDKINDVDRRHGVVTSVLDRFQLTDEERAALESTNVNEQFFDALEHAHMILVDTKILIQTYHQRLGLDIIDELSKLVTVAYERLYLWAQTEIRTLSGVGTPEVNTMLVRALTALRKQTAYYEHCCDEIFRARKGGLVRRFLSALTRGGPYGSARPIELHAHDPVRYVSDMLAWLHQAVAGERELLGTLFKEKGQIDEKKVMATIFEGVSQQLRVRVEQALVTQPEPIICFQVSNVIEFYCSTIGTMFEDSSTFQHTLDSLCKQAEGAFFDVLNQQVQQLQADPPAYPSDLSPPTQVLDVLNLVGDLLSLAASSLVSGDKTEQHFAPILSMLLDPLSDIIASSASDLDAADMAVYQINTLHSIRSVLENHTLVQSRLEILSLAVESQLEQLVDVQLQMVLRQCGLHNVVQAFDAYLAQGKPTPLVQAEGMERKVLEDGLQGFFTAVVGLGTFSLPACDRILHPQLRAQVNDETALRVAQRYRQLYSAVLDSSSGYAEPETLFRHTPIQIEKLLGIASN